VRFTVGEVAELTGYSVRTLRRHIAAGRLPVRRVGRKVYITAAGARLWLGHTLPLWNAQPSAAWRVVSVRVYAAIAGISEREVRHQIAKEAIAVEKIGGRVFITASELDAALRSQQGDIKNR
jgi:excisionase family DNA binding protein